MSIFKDFRYPVRVVWRGGRTVRTVAPEKDLLEVATPPEFPGGVRGVWSPEELLVNAAASCYALTLAAVAERMRVPIDSLEVRGCGYLAKREDGRFRFVAIELEASFETDAATSSAAQDAADRASDVCIVTHALDVPVRVAVEVHVRGGTSIAAVA